MKVQIRTAAAAALVVALAAATPSAASHDASGTARCATAETLLEARLLDRAEKVFLDALHAPGGTECATEGLASVTSARDALRRADAVAARFEADAAAEATRRAEREAAAEERARRGAFWRWLDQGVDDLANLLLLLVPLALLLALVLRQLARVRALQLLPPLRWMRRVRVDFGTFDDAALDRRLGPGTAALVRARLARASRPHGVGFVTGESVRADAAGALSAVSDEGRRAAAVIRLYEALLRRAPLRVSGVLQSPGDQGPGIGVAIEGDDEHTVWAAAHGVAGDGAAAYQALAVPAAAWLEHRVALAAGAKPFTSDSASYALFRAGVQAHAAGDETAARDLYEAALGLDPGNAGALANLGVLSALEHDYAGAVALFDRAVDDLPRGSVDGLRARLNLVSTLVNAAADPAQDGWLDLAREASHKLLQEALGARSALGPHARDWLDTTVEPLAALLYVDAHAETPSEILAPPAAADRSAISGTVAPPVGQVLAFALRRPHLAPQVSYSLACIHSRLIAETGGDAVQRQELVHSALDHLSVALRASYTPDRDLLARKAPDDPTLQPLEHAAPEEFRAVLEED